MLTDDVERYLALRRSLGFKLQRPSIRLPDFARFAIAGGDTHIRAATAVAWATLAPTRRSRDARLSDVVRLSRFLRAEDLAHEVPPVHLFKTPRPRPAPYIYTPEELVRILEVAGALRRQKPSPLRRETYVMLFGLLAATGLRISEALNLRLGDLLPGGILRIGETKFGASRLVPMHKTVAAAFDRYLEARDRFAGTDDHVFLSVGARPLTDGTARCTFHRILLLANIGTDRARRPRIHDLRHTFATRVLEQCATQREAVDKHFVALSTYLGHAGIASTYWYLEATPELMTGIAAAAEALAAGEGA